MPAATAPARFTANVAHGHSPGAAGSACSAPARAIAPTDPPARTASARHAPRASSAASPRRSLAPISSVAVMRSPSPGGAAVRRIAASLTEPVVQPVHDRLARPAHRDASCTRCRGALLNACRAPHRTVVRRAVSSSVRGPVRSSNPRRRTPMPEVVFSVDQSKSMADQAVPGHNRWHPDIPPAASVAPGSEFRVECREWTDAQLGNNDSSNDVRDVDLTVCHMLSGPIEVQGAEPGDLLVVDILDLGPVPAAAGVRRRARPGLGLHRGVRQGQRRRLPDRPLPRRLQGDLGLPRPGRDVPPPPGRALHGHHPPGAVRHRAVGRPAGRVEPPRAGADRQGPGPRAAAGAAAARGRHARGHPDRRRAATGSAARARARFRRARTAATTTSRTSRAAAGSSTRSTSPARSSPAATCTSRRATARSRSAARSRWAASSTSASTSSRAGMQTRTGSRPTRC